MKHGNNKHNQRKGEITMSRWTTIEINGKTFELDTKETEQDPIVFYKSVYDVYGRCSDTKKAIWEKWSRWFNECNSHMYGVTSHNCNFFTISGVVTWGEDEYFLVITASHNRAWKVKRAIVC